MMSKDVDLLCDAWHTFTYDLSKRVVAYYSHFRGGELLSKLIVSIGELCLVIL